jgi:hypothetical protein
MSKRPLVAIRSPGGVLTPPGMAHWAGTGPRDATCRECVSWRATGKWFSEGPGSSGAPMPARCTAYRTLGMLRSFGPAVPHDTPSCKVFVRTTKPQPIKRPEKIEADWLA